MQGQLEKIEKREALLALRDGRVFKALASGAARDIKNPILGEVVFNTSLYGYQEVLSDPSYAGQIVTFTYPHIGNVGCNSEDMESEHLHAQALICRNISKSPSNYRSQKSLTDLLHSCASLAIEELDTRALVKHLRDYGAQMGAIACGENINRDDLIDIAKQAGSMEGKEYVSSVTCKTPYHWCEKSWSIKDGHKELSQSDLWSRPHCVALDCGVKNNILRLLIDAGFRLTVVPAFTSAAEIMKLKPDGVFLSNGPGDPATLVSIVAQVKELLGKVAIFGICLGHQILGQAIGGKTYKLPFGHRGGNHPVINTESGKVEITVQNHGFAVDSNSISSSSNSVVSHINLNDQTVEGLILNDLKAFSLQYHPEASPGPHDAIYNFKRFFEMVVC